MTEGLAIQRAATLCAFFAASALPEFLWSNFPPIMTLVEAKYGISESQASLPIIMFSVGTVLSARTAGRMVDRQGYHVSTRVGLGMLAVFAVLRMIDGPFWLLVVAQTGIGAAFSFIAGAATSYVADWFEGKSAALVSGLCVIGLYVGLGSSMVVTPLWVEHFGFLSTMRATAAATVVIAIAASILLRRRAPLSEPTLRTPGRVITGRLFPNRALMLLFIISYLTGGLFSAVATALEPIWVERGFSASQAGAANGLFIFGGIIGSLLMPLLQNLTHSAKTVLVGCSLGILLLTYPLFIAPDMWVGSLIAVALGIFWMGNIPVCYTLVERAAGTERAGAALSAFWAINSAGSVTLVWLFTAVAERTSWREAAGLTLLLLAINQLAAFALPDDRPARAVKDP